MIPEIEEELTSSLAQEGTIMMNVFQQLSAEAIYYAYLSKQGHGQGHDTTAQLPSSNNTICVNNKTNNTNQSDATTTPSGGHPSGGHQRKWGNNKGDELHNCKKNKDLQNKNKLFHNLLSEEYSMLKSRSVCESKEGLYQAIAAGYGPKTVKMDKNHSNHKKFIQKAKEGGSLTNQKPNENFSNPKNSKVRFRSDHHKSANSENEDSNIRSTRKNEMYLIWGLAGDYRLMKWRKKREKAEGRYQKYLANRRKRELKKELAQSLAKQNAAGSSSNNAGGTSSGYHQALGGLSTKPAKKFIKKKPFVIQKSLGYDYRHCLKKKKNREDDEASYQLYLAGNLAGNLAASITPPPPHSIASGAPSYVVSSAPKMAAPKVLCCTGGRPKAKKSLNVSFDLPEEDDDDIEPYESKDLLLFQCLALDSANMAWRQRCEGSEAHYHTAIGMKEKNDIKA